MDFEYKINSLEDYVTLISEISKPYQGKLQLGLKLLFRGQANSNWALLPKIARGKSSDAKVALLDYERNLIESAKYRLPSVFGVEMSPLDLLALLQHYGIATRLMDVTSNPLVALFFACTNSHELNSDGEVIVFQKCIEDIAPYPIQNAIADSYRFIHSGDISLELFFNNIKNQSYTSEQQCTLNLLFDNSAKGAEWIKQCCSQIIYVQAKEQIMRQKLQQGEYILFSNRIAYSEILGKDSFKNYIDEIPKKDAYIKNRIIISKESKLSIIESLNIFGINEGTLFADSIDAVCRQIENDIKRLIFQ